MDGTSTETAPRPAVITVADCAETPLPSRIGRYVVLRQLGRGGMGVVYSAYDADLDRKVAIKVVRDTLQHSSLGRTRVLQEAQAMARVAHPNVVHVYEVGQDDAGPGNQVFIAMEFVPGCSLAEWQSRHRGAASLDELTRLYLQAAAGLSAAHDCGLIHRDFKPDNVLIGEDGRARVVDFGLARALDGPREEPVVTSSEPRANVSGQRLTEAGAILGTPGYMAPEQVTGVEADARSDQFSFCAALYEALYRELPFPGDTFEEFAKNVLSGKLRPPPQGQTGALEVPIFVEQALRRGLSRDPAARFPSMKSLIEALTAGLRPDSDSRRTRRSKRVLLWAGIGGLISLLTMRLLLMPRTGSKDLSPSLTLGVIGFVASLIFWAVVHGQLRHQTLVRRGTFILLLTTSYLVTARTFGYVMRIDPIQYHTLELLGVATLFASEVPQVGKKYLIPVAIALLGATLQVILPQYARLHVNIAYILLVLLGATLRPWSLGPTSQLREDRKDGEDKGEGGR